jgi:tetratricopeptide (TPR) repeat protein
MNTNDNSQSEFEETLDMARSLLAGDSDSGDALEANDLVGRALSLRPESCSAWILKCQVLSSLDDDIAALASVEMAIRFSPKAAEAHYWRAAVLSDLGRLDEALRAINRCFRYASLDDSWLLEDLYCEKAMILDALGLSEEAVAAYEAGLKRCPSSSLLHAGLAPMRRAKLKSDMKVLRGGLG